MKITKRQLRRIIKEEILREQGGGADMNLAMQSLASGDTNTATEAILDSLGMDDTWRMEEDALEDMLIDLGPNATTDQIGAVSDEWLAGVRAGTWRPKTPEEQKADWARGNKPRQR